MEVETLDRVYKDVRLVSMLAKFLGRVCPIDLEFNPRLVGTTETIEALNIVFFLCDDFFLQIGWYNEHVQEVFRLSYPADTLGLLVISTPDMFERAFIPFVKQQEESDGIRDPIDQCVAYYFNKVKEVHSMTYYACTQYDTY